MKVGTGLNVWPWGTWTGEILLVTHCCYLQLQFQAEGNAKFTVSPSTPAPAAGELL